MEVFAISEEENWFRSVRDTHGYPDYYQLLLVIFGVSLVPYLTADSICEGYLNKVLGKSFRKYFLPPPCDEAMDRRPHILKLANFAAGKLGPRLSRQIAKEIVNPQASIGFSVYPEDFLEVEGHYSMTIVAACPQG
ncbi:hypothetical protein VP1G_10647 [Cytospora mali]|uniref:Uncharacterized protein n=1 Tax=Cytospora mali TaxID=578113 RepID=A0A194UR64_CYTMA|nr:hypothetical protein VP1G_10647 [Valsa mali var. pyri (nom. inval.)]